eukprot:ANDGO_00825.mRNA.1 mitochondrial Probable phospholipase YOR022C
MSSLDHLVLCIPGIGSRSIRNSYNTPLPILVNHLQSNIQLVSPPNLKIALRFIDWSTSVHNLVDAPIAALTPPSIPRMRNFLNTVLCDVLLFLSPVYGPQIVESVISQLNRTYEEQNTRYSPAKYVSIVAHSLGGVIFHHILKEHSDKLAFQVHSFICLGSPLGLFSLVSGMTEVDRRVRNIFHPLDPVGYRVEPLEDEGMSAMAPVMLPHWIPMRPQTTTSASSASASASASASTLASVSTTTTTTMTTTTTTTSLTATSAFPSSTTLQSQMQPQPQPQPMVGSADTTGSSATVTTSTLSASSTVSTSVVLPPAESESAQPAVVMQQAESIVEAAVAADEIATMTDTADVPPPEDLDAIMASGVAPLPRATPSAGPPSSVMNAMKSGLSSIMTRVSSWGVGVGAAMSSSNPYAAAAAAASSSFSSMSDMSYGETATPVVRPLPSLVLQQADSPSTTPKKPIRIPEVRKDYVLQLDSSALNVPAVGDYIGSLRAHTRYWYERDVAWFIVSELVRNSNLKP